MQFSIPAGAAASVKIMVRPEHTATRFGSGSVNVLATPMMIALMEQAAFDTVQPHLPQGWTTVGTLVEVEHLRPSPVGAKVTAQAMLVEQDGKTLVFSVSASDSLGEIGRGRLQRKIIELQPFLERIASLDRIRKKQVKKERP